MTAMISSLGRTILRWCSVAGLVLAALLSLGCGWREETPDNNGQGRKLHLQPTHARWNGDTEKTGFCGRDPELPDPTCGFCGGVPVATVGSLHDWSITRRIWVRSGNGLGDSTQYDDDIPLVAAVIEVNVDPPAAANVQEIFPCDGGVRILLNAALAQDFELSATIDEYTDVWLVHAVQPCDVIDICSN